MKKYPRDLLGYGSNPPKVEWPNNSNIAIQFVLNYEEGGENCILHGDDHSEAFLSEIIGATEWQGQRHLNIESIYNYGSRVGFWRLHKLFTQENIPITVFGVASALQRSPEQVGAMKEAQWEIACHGLKWIEYKDFSIEKERHYLFEAIKIHEVVTGSSPKGWYLGRCTENTVSLVSETQLFDYISDSYEDDLPYWISNEKHNQLIIPYTLDTNDMRFATTQGFNSWLQFFDHLKATFDTLYAEGESGSAKIMNIGLHCRLIGRPGRIKAIQEFIKYTKTFERVWYARRIDIAEYWKAHHPRIAPKIIPFTMNKKDFLWQFGNVFEHSPWVAQKTYEFELNPSMNSAKSLHAFMCHQFRSATIEDRLAVINSHPDLGQGIAQLDSLTKESQSEQFSAGLKYLTPEEYDIFFQLNSEYLKQFSHPFIMAVKHKTKNEILSQFKIRLQNSREEEFKAACSEIEKIALLRIEEIFKHEY